MHDYHKHNIQLCEQRAVPLKNYQLLLRHIVLGAGNGVLFVRFIYDLSSALAIILVHAMLRY